jgi:hypothetical protein
VRIDHTKLWRAEDVSTAVSNKQKA